MPTVSVGRDLLFAALKQQFTDDQFDELCFEYGIELDDVTTEKQISTKMHHKESSEGVADDEEVRANINCLR